jgi:hypothetical protein
MGDKKNAYMLLMDIPVGKSMLGKTKRRWENIKIVDKEIGWEGVY